MDQQRIFPRIYSPHLIDYFRTWGFKAGQEFLTWRPEPGVPGYTALPEEDTLVGELFCLRLRVSPGTTEKSHHQRLKFERIIRHSGPSGTYFNTASCDCFFSPFRDSEDPLSSERSRNICCLLSSCAVLCAANVRIPSPCTWKTRADPSGGFSWSRSRHVTWGSCQRRSQSASSRQEWQWRSHFPALRITPAAEPD